MKKVYAVLLISFIGFKAYANPMQVPFILPTAKVLPKGVRNLSYKGAIINASRKFDETGGDVIVAEPFFRPLSFKEIIRAEQDPAKRGLIEDAMNSINASANDSFGHTTGQVNAKVNAHVPVFAWGLSKNFTLATVIPIVKSSLNIDTGVIQQNEQLHQRMISDIKAKGASAKVVEFIEKMNSPISQKADEYNYQPLRNENTTELGDIRLIGKYQVIGNELNRFTLTSALTLPTGKDQDVDKLVDIVSGDDQTDIAFGADYDYLINGNLTVTVGTLYTFQLPDDNPERIPYQVDSKISADVDKSTQRDLGDIWMGAVAAQYTREGFVAALGYNYQVRQRDQYSGSQFESFRYHWIGEETKQKMHSALASIGYNTISLFRAGKFPVPLGLTLTHTRILDGENVVNDALSAVDMSIFF